MKHPILAVGDSVAIVAMSDPCPQEIEKKISQLCVYLASLGLRPVVIGRISADDTAEERAVDLMRCYLDPSIAAILDVSGGDASNMILDYLDYDLIAANPKPFVGYSDLSALIGALVSRGGQRGILYSPLRLVGEDAPRQQKIFARTMLEGSNALYTVPWEIWQAGDYVDHPVIGGNLRCFLKLAGTPYFPDLQGKVLFLESLGGGRHRVASYLSQLRQMGAFDQVCGLLFGRFTALEAELSPDDVRETILACVDQPSLFVAKTDHIGHDASDLGIVLGAPPCNVL